MLWGKIQFKFVGTWFVDDSVKNYSSEIHNKLFSLLNLPKHKIILFSEIRIKVNFSNNIDHHYRCYENNKL